MAHPCTWCASTRTKIVYRDRYHKVDRSFGPFNLAVCQDCGSLSTANPPSPERLAEFYRRYDEFRPDWYVAGAAGNALEAQYRYYARFLESQMGAAASWLDVGAGHGEVAGLIQRHIANRRGVAVDIGPRPGSLPAGLDYRQLDLNQSDWHEQIGTYDFVFSLAVWEHVLSPEAFAHEALRVVSPGGTLVLITPDYGSLARKVFHTWWPYFEPGEHISIPTKKGAEACLRRAALRVGIDAEIRTVSLNVAYSVRYVLEVLRLSPIAKLVPSDFAAALPTGILAAIVKLADASSPESGGERK